jgi:hypothetical protein
MLCQDVNKMLLSMHRMVCGCQFGILLFKLFYLLEELLMCSKAMKGIVFWEVMLYSLVEVYRRFTGMFCFHLQG